MRCEVIRMGMGNKGKIPRPVRIKPETRTGKFRITPLETKPDLAGTVSFLRHATGYACAPPPGRNERESGLSFAGLPAHDP